MQSVPGEQKLQTTDFRCTPLPHPAPPRKQAAFACSSPCFLVGGGGGTKYFQDGFRVKMTLGDVPCPLTPHPPRIKLDQCWLQIENSLPPMSLGLVPVPNLAPVRDPNPASDQGQCPDLDMGLDLGLYACNSSGFD